MNYLFEVMFIIWGIIAFILDKDKYFTVALFAVAALFGITGAVIDYVAEYRRRR
jgi:hypothetical protein